MAISTDNVVFDREPLKVDQLWVATHPSGQEEHIGFHTAAEARAEAAATIALSKASDTTNLPSSVMGESRRAQRPRMRSNFR